MGASPLQIIVSVIIREALGPLILGFTFIFIAVVDMSAMAGYIGGGGLGDFAITYGYNAFNPTITLAGTIVIILIVQVAQLLGNFLSKKNHAPLNRSMPLHRLYVHHHPRAALFGSIPT